MSKTTALRSARDTWTRNYPDIPRTTQELSLSVQPEGVGIKFQLLFGDLSELPSRSLKIHNPFEAHQRFDRIDYILKTLGQMARCDPGVQDNTAIAETVAVNLTGAFYISKVSRRHLEQSRHMLLHFCSSSCKRGCALYTPYSTCKAGIVNLTQVWLKRGRTEALQ